MNQHHRGAVSGAIGQLGAHSVQRDVPIQADHLPLQAGLVLAVDLYGLDLR